MLPTDSDVTILSFRHVARRPQTKKDKDTDTVDGNRKRLRSKTHAKCCTFPGSLMGEGQAVDLHARPLDCPALLFHPLLLPFQTVAVSLWTGKVQEF